jgi:secreted PhoX family phosphatase
VLRNGVVYAGDEQRPGSDTLDSDGGAIFKFVPASPYVCDEPILGSRTGEGGVCVNRIGDLSASPLASGSVYAYTASCQSRSSASFPQYGQGCEVGAGAWVKVDATTARADADAYGATGYYRPEDLHRDRATGDGMPDQPNVFFCWNNTGNEGADNYAETVCMLDEDILGDGTKVDARTGFTYLADAGQPRGYAVATANRLMEGDMRFNSFDNLDIQPVSGNIYVVEDHEFGEIWACLPDGVDTNIKSDGCLAMLSIRDPEAEPTGFIFDGTGKTAYYILQHGQQFDELLDFESNPVDGMTDDLMKITGFRLRTP